MGEKLIEADGRGLRLTNVGKKFLEEVRPLLQAWLQIPKTMQTQASGTPSRIASFEVFTTYFLGHLLKYTDLANLEIHEYGPGKMEREVAEGKIDFAITYLPVPKAGIEFTEVTKIKMGVFGLEKYKPMKLMDLPFVIPILPTEGTPSKIIGLDGWPDHLFERQVKYQVTMMESAMELCRESHAVAYLPEFVVEFHNKRMLPEYRLKELKCPIPKEERLQSVFLIRRQGSPENSLERQIAKSLRSLK